MRAKASGSWSGAVGIASVALAGVVLCAAPRGARAGEAPDATPDAATARNAIQVEEPSAQLTAALKWLADHQEENGSWSARKYSGRKPDHAVSSLALLAFLHAGSTDTKGPHAASVAKTLAWLKSEQVEDGRIGPHAYEAGVVLIALVEALNRCDDKNLPGVIQRFADYAVRTQKAAGGWDYQPTGLANNTAVSGWWIVGLTAARNAGIQVPETALAKARAYMERSTDEKGRTAYHGVYATLDDVKPGAGTTFLSAMALTCLEELNSKEEKKMDAAAKRAMANRPAVEDLDFYRWAWIAWSFYRRGETAPEQWNTFRKLLHPTLESTQVTEGAHVGSWDPFADRWGPQWGRVGQTAFGAIMLAILESHPPSKKAKAAETK